MDTSRKLSSSSLSDEVGVELCRVLGLVVNNISVYGTAHSVTATSISKAFDELTKHLDIYGEIEFVVSSTGLLLNGTSIQTERTTGQLFVSQLNKIDVHDFALKSPINRKEFSTFMSILAAAPGSKIVADGFETAVAKAGFKCIRVTNVSYARVDKNADLEKMTFDGSGGGAGGSGGSGGGAQSFDLDMDVSFSEMGFEVASESVDPVVDLSSDAVIYLKEKKHANDLQQKLVDRIKESGSSPDKINEIKKQLLDSGFSKNEWNEILLESGVMLQDDTNETGSVETLNVIRKKVENLTAAHLDAIAAGESSDEISSILESIGHEVEKLDLQTKEHATTLFSKVDADRETIAAVELDARARGIGLNLSRDELLESLAEINQELAQSLTVISSVTEILTKENLGAINQPQKDILNVANDGVDRINKLVSYLCKLSGLPKGLLPDKDIIDEAYGQDTVTIPFSNIL